jgi:hypothetical protein
VRNLCLPSGECSHRCAQGSDCAGSLSASQLALGLRALHTEDGGSWFLGHRVLRLRPEVHSCPPAAAPEPARPSRLNPFACFGAVAGLAAAAACVVALGLF